VTAEEYHEDDMQVARTERSTVTGSYDLMGVNGSVLPAPVDEGSMHDGEEVRCRILAGELRLEEDGSYRLALTARYEAGTRTAYTRVLASDGTWRCRRRRRAGWSSRGCISGKRTERGVADGREQHTGSRGLPPPERSEGSCRGTVRAIPTEGPSLRSG
jgi:hypothetical protein